MEAKTLKESVMAERNEQGTGQHPHKSSEEPYSHHEAPATKGRSEENSHGASSGSREKSQSSRSNQGKKNTQSREYKGPHGEEHHHTKSYMEQHKKDKAA
jgi:hypothetical protein